MEVVDYGAAFGLTNFNCQRKMDGMWIARDMESTWTAGNGMPVRILRGMRQCGKSSLLMRLAKPGRSYVTLDDLSARNVAESDPALLFMQYPPPVTVDEVQYSPALFPEIKLRVDEFRRAGLLNAERVDSPSFWLTGSNQALMASRVRESLAGRASHYTLHTLSYAELKHAIPRVTVGDALIKGGWPEIYTNPGVDSTRYLNDYINTFLEKDVAASSGIEKLQSFTRALGLMAARTACTFNASEIAALCGVRSSTIQEWASILERNLVLFLLPAFHSNLNKRLVKSHKLYFLDAGLTARLQGWSEAAPLLVSPQAGRLFETLVLCEIIKTRDHFARDWQTFYWRTREGDEIDFLVMDRLGRCIAIEAKLGIQSAQPVILSRKRPGLPDVTQVAVVTAGGGRLMLSPDSVRIPLEQVREYLLERFD